MSVLGKPCAFSGAAGWASRYRCTTSWDSSSPTRAASGWPTRTSPTTTNSNWKTSIRGHDGVPERRVVRFTDGGRKRGLPPAGAPGPHGRPDPANRGWIAGDGGRGAHARPVAFGPVHRDEAFGGHCPRAFGATGMRAL